MAGSCREPKSPAATASCRSPAGAAWERSIAPIALKLGHPVALKFLPRGVAESSRRFQLFVSEVRLSRQLAHPNCLPGL